MSQGPRDDQARFAPVAPSPGLVTNEWAHFNRGNAGARVSRDWDVTSGSLFARDGGFWSGKPDSRTPDEASGAGTNSAVFRLVSTRADLDASRVALRLRLNGMTTTPSTPRSEWDGVHLFLRYQSPANTYYASVARRDGSVAVKKKCPGGDVNGGRYVQLGAADGHPVQLGSWMDIEATVTRDADSSVRVTIRRDGKVVLTAADGGTGCPKITTPGRVGLRGDNTDFDFTDFTVAS